MKIYRMIATFGKLRHEELTFHDGLNVIRRPNEWGKSTWCAFLVAMFYGIDTKEHNKQGYLAEKTRYAPWSGEGMSGRIDLCWEGRDITVERAPGKNGILEKFRAYETESGIDVPELTGENCGQMLLGVEKSVFLRSGFLKMSDLPVTQDDALRRRLNALVTTGDESAAGDQLVTRLKSLKNECKHNKTGKLCQAVAEREDAAEKLAALRGLQTHCTQITGQQEALNDEIEKLENHLVSLEYARCADQEQRYTQALLRRDQAQEAYLREESQCRTLPTPEQAGSELRRLDDLRKRQDALQQEARMRPDAPNPPDVLPFFRGLTPEQAEEQAKQDSARYAQAAKTGKWRLPAGIVGLVAGIAGLMIPLLPLRIAAGILLIAGGILLVRHFVITGKAATELAVLREKYRPLPPEKWVESAIRYRTEQAQYESEMAGRRQMLADWEKRNGDCRQEISGIGMPLSEKEAELRQILDRHNRLKDIHKELLQAQALVDGLSPSRQEAPPPRFPDLLTCSKEQSAVLLSDARRRQAQYREDLGRCVGQMALLGQEEDLCRELKRIDARVFRLEEIYRALEIALQAAEDAKSDLQRRFAPRISRQAQEIFSRLTGGRYDRMKLEEDLSVSVGAEGEDILRPSLWRSDGTVDQLYLALRLAVARELMPDAPLILDDALVRFDDQRMKTALEVLKQENKQILLFTCQEREEAALN